MIKFNIIQKRKVGLALHILLLKDTYFIVKELLKLNNALNTCLISQNIILCYY